MTLTVVVGSSGSGKTTFLEHVQKLNKAVYIRQYHTLRPYVPVCKIPSFDPTKLPFWELYSQQEALNGDSSKKNESYNPNIKIGGTMAGEFVAGLSGGQRKMMLFELVHQRIESKSNLLVCLDEPFCGITEDFVPFIVDRLNEMRKTHNVLLVTNDHVQTLTDMADSIITVSAIDRSKILVNGKSFDREVALHAVSNGEMYTQNIGNEDLWFFFDTEVLSPQILGCVGFTVFAFGLFLLSFWDSKPGSEALVVVAVQIVAFFALQPYLVALPDWRNTVIEEAEALMHCSVQTNKVLKAALVLVLLVALSAVAYGCLNAVSDTLTSADFWIFMLFDSASLTLPFICFGLYTLLPLQVVQIVASMPFLFFIFFSTTFSPGAGVEGIKALRYLFPRFYFWCKMPLTSSSMEDCPADNMLIFYAILTGCLGMLIFLSVQLVGTVVGAGKQKAMGQVRDGMTGTKEFIDLQRELKVASSLGSAEAAVTTSST